VLETKYMNTFVWLDLNTPDHGRAKDFYATLFDWSYEEMPIDGLVYSIALVRGNQVAGIVARGDESRRPSQWTAYVSVDDVDRVAEAATSLGGKLLRQPFDVMELGRVAVVEDRSGAAIGLWQSGASGGPTVFNQHGTLNWTELATNDTAAARDFYTTLFGWRFEERSMDDGGRYALFVNGDQSACGVTNTMKDVSADWLLYFDIDDTDARVEKARAVGAIVVKGPTDTMFGRHAVLRDPHGAAFSVISATEGVRHFPF
jgi:predicted enzyme related to lactoylglutathione lyase